MIRFVDFLEAPDAKRTKVKFNMKNGNTNVRAWDLLLEDESAWVDINSWKTKHPTNNLNRADYLIALAQYYPYGSEYFVFGGVYKVETIFPEAFDCHGYKLTLMNDYQEYRKRLIIKLEKPIGRDNYLRLYENVQKQLNPEIYELAPNTKLGHFPGYQSVSLSYKDLRQIISQNEPSWRQALSNVKGVYVITDLSDGRLYIGSASGNTDGIWQRWSAYADKDNPTGDNKDLVKILETRGKNHIEENFKYSILEIFDTKTKVDTIIERENYWKAVLDTKQHGMNRN